MKGGVGWGSTKRRWRWPVIGVLGLVLLSMLVPLVFLLGFHSSGYVSEQRHSPSIDFKNIDGFEASSDNNHDQSQDLHSTHIEDIIEQLVPTVFKDVTKSFADETNDKTIVQSTPQTKGPPNMGNAIKPPAYIKDTTMDDTLRINQTKSMNVAVVDGEIFCELKYGSYCIWRQEHREEMQDSMVKKLKDQLFVARAYFPSIAKLPAHDKLSREMKLNIQELERILSESTTDADLPPQMEKKVEKMRSVIARAKSLVSDCNNVDKKLRQLVDLTEDEANFHMKQSAYLYQIAVQTVPKSHHCLSMKLTVEYFTSPSPDLDLLPASKYMETAKQHFVIVSNNVLASSVVINSTVMRSRDSGNLIFHVITDGHNYFSMKLWFFKNIYQEAIVEVMNIEDLELPYHDKEALHLSLSEEFRVSFRTIDSQSATHVKTDYLSVFSHLHFLLPEIFHHLDKIVVLDDDVVVQQDLSALWSLDMSGKIMGAIMYCKVKLGQLKNYFGENRFDDDSCAWMSGLNVIDLVQWRAQNLTGTYQMLLKEYQSHKDESAGITSLRASLLALQNKIYPLDHSWALSGLGHNYGLNMESFKNAAVLHYNGKMKPWLDMGIPKYKKYWKKYLDLDNRYLSDCNINA